MRRAARCATAARTWAPSASGRADHSKRQRSGRNAVATLVPDIQVVPGKLTAA